MDTEQIIKASKSTQRLIQDEFYYRYIFKKTERVVSVVFYITQSVSLKQLSSTLIEDLERTAHDLHNAILRSLEARTHVAEDAIYSAIHALVALESKLHVAHATGVVSEEILGVLVEETDSIVRSMNRYLEHDEIHLAPSIAPTAKKPQRMTAPAAQQRTQSSKPTPPHTTPERPEQHDRRAQIKTIIEAKGEVSITDITAIIKDVSQKTVQRELNDMIDERIIKREGERRWARYSLF